MNKVDLEKLLFKYIEFSKIHDSKYCFNEKHDNCLDRIEDVIIKLRDQINDNRRIY